MRNIGSLAWIFLSYLITSLKTLTFDLPDDVPHVVDVQGRCNREKPACKYFHPPQHLKVSLTEGGDGDHTSVGTLHRGLGIYKQLIRNNYIRTSY